MFFRSDTGAPVTGLTPTATAVFKDGTGGAPAATVAEVAAGFYRVTFASPLTKDVLVQVDGGATLTTTRYAALEVPVGGYLDLIDSAITGRASAADVAALGSPAQASTVAALIAAVQDDTDALQIALAALTVAVGDPAQASAYTPARAALLDSLTQLDVATSTRASAVDLANALAGLAVLLGRLTATRAALLDLLINLDVPVSTRATPADVTITPDYEGTVT